MNPNDPNISIVELAAKALGELRNETVLVGGCAVGLLITDDARPPVRATKDVDLLIEVGTKDGYYEFSEKLRARGFQEVMGDVLCRWKFGSLLLDVMPADERILGFGNQWYQQAIETANDHKLPSTTTIKIVTAPFFVATKIEAFYGRGEGDYQRSHDIEDIVNLIDGRAELAEEISLSPTNLRDYLCSEIEGFLSDGAFTEALPGHFPPDSASQARLPIVISRLRAISGI